MQWKRNLKQPLHLSLQFLRRRGRIREPVMMTRVSNIQAHIARPGILIKQLIHTERRLFIQSAALYQRERMIVSLRMIDRLEHIPQNTTLTSVPFPTALSSDSSPWWSATPCLTIDRPRPVPPVWREWLLSTR